MIRVWKIARWLLLCLLIGGLGRYIYQHSEEFGIVRQVSVGLIAAQIVLFSALLILNAAQGFLVVRSFGLAIPFSTWLRISVYSRFLNRFCPQAGNAYRLAELKLSHGFPVSRYLVSFGAFSVLNRIFTLCYVLVIILLWSPALTLGGYNAATALFLLLVGAGVGFLLLRWLCSFGRARWTGRSKYIEKVAELMDGVVGCFLDKRILGGVFVLSLVSLFISVYANWLCFSALGASIGFPALAILKLAKSTTDSISVTPGNVGVTEALYGVLGSELESSASVAILVAALLNVTAILGVALLSGVLMLIAKIKREPLR